MKVGMLRSKCPVCGQIIHRHSYEIDRVHKCRNSDGTRKTTKTNFEQIPSRTNIKFDKQFFTNIGTDPLGVRSKNEKRKSAFYETNVDTYIEFD